MAGPALDLVYHLAVAGAEYSHHAAHAGLVLRRAHNVDVVGHETVGEYLELEPMRVVTQPGQIPHTVSIREEHVLFAAASYCDVLRHSHSDYSSIPGHAKILADSILIVNKIVSVPINDCQRHPVEV